MVCKAPIIGPSGKKELRTGCKKFACKKSTTPKIILFKAIFEVLKVQFDSGIQIFTNKQHFVLALLNRPEMRQGALSSCSIYMYLVNVKSDLTPLLPK